MSKPPIASKEDKVLEIHNDRRIDPYFWMRDIENENTLKYLHAENEYLEASFSGESSLRESLFNELKGRIKESDSSSPMKEERLLVLLSIR